MAKALDLLQAHGLEAVSTRRLAEGLGVSGPSLYWHFTGMPDLRSHMAEALLFRALEEAKTSEDWPTWVAEGARAIRRAALSHRDGAHLLAIAEPTERLRAQWQPNLMRLQAAGFSERGARYAFSALHRYALGSALAEQAAGPASSGGAFEYGLKALIVGLEIRP